MILEEKQYFCLDFLVPQARSSVQTIRLIGNAKQAPHSHNLFSLPWEACTLDWNRMSILGGGLPVETLSHKKIRSHLEFALVLLQNHRLAWSGIHCRRRISKHKTKWRWNEETNYINKLPHPILRTVGRQSCYGWQPKPCSLDICYCKCETATEEAEDSLKYNETSYVLRNSLSKWWQKKHNKVQSHILLISPHSIASSIRMSWLAPAIYYCIDTLITLRKKSYSLPEYHSSYPISSLLQDWRVSLLLLGCHWTFWKASPSIGSS